MGSISILKIGDILIIPLTMELHDKMAAGLQEEILKKIYETRARGLLIDMTTVKVVDSFMGRMLSDTATMAMTMGVETVLAGIQPGIAITLQEMGLELKGIRTALNLERGMMLLQDVGEEGHGED
jgi:rsbT antagonist protein RsbS